MIEAIFVAFGIAALLLFRYVASARAVAITCFAGWLLLPVGHFPKGSADVAFPYWITGTAVPSDMLLTKMWWPPVFALAGALLTDCTTLARWRPGWIDAPMFLWCLWPIGQWPFVADSAPQPWIASLYLAAAWGAPWLLGRLYFSGDEGNMRLIMAIVAGLSIIAPIALIETVAGPNLYGWIYELHPFRADGIERYVGFRPIGFFEHGNQYGIWVAATALAATWLWRAEPDTPSRGRSAALAMLALAVAVMSQSVGAILLLFAGLVVLRAIGRPLTRWMLALVLVLTVGVGAIYLSGAVPFRTFANDTVIGRRMVDIVRSTGRESITWRIARDQRALTIIGEHPVLGTARWDWWRRNDERPWGLALLIFGQFGLIGFVLAFGSLLLPTLRTFDDLYNSPTRQRRYPSAPLAMIVLMAIADALLNSFFFYPAILAAGALGSTVKQSRWPEGPADHREKERKVSAEDVRSI
jgi:hypothetical protein